ncbi:hypothetical protein NDI37_07985 [Funiculus sociatus GB2-A5]|uniref:Uncharacterized protein n=1 Tax=Funiculus sociatus GB2-A5 TaxID=2933946 RepID=A0ABV0JLT7_9CYAN|nr:MULTISPECIES: hypothetical protein [unclassified Trichocoleus]MBD1907175.1 hypothetical protein [Trichocoleus sp. FACHB-832]MBD2064218.1 hypothetical protein [Trichocoleus sp. FACHB-6]
MGVSCNIRRETVLQFAKQGVNLVVAACSQVGLNLRVDKSPRMGSNAVPVVADATVFEQVKAVKAVETSSEDQSTPNVLYSNSI